MQKQNQGVFYIDGASLTIDTLDDILAHKKKIELSDTAWEKVKKSRKTIDNMMVDPEKVVYGITTGFGSFANVSISPEQRSQLQINLIRSHAVGVGQPIPITTARKMLILRINTLSKGRSGVKPETLQKLVAAYNGNFIPRIPCQGTVGASGDLAPLSHLALGLMGQGLAYDIESESYRPAQEMLDKLGLTKISLSEKQGLALINGTQFMSSIISNVAFQARKLIKSSMVIYALATEIFGVDKNLFSKQTEQFYAEHNSELSGVIRQIREILGEEETELHKSRSFEEEVHSLLDFPEALAGVIKNVNMATQMIEQQMNSATDNPLVYYKQEGVEEDKLVSAGNFHGQYVAKASDFLGFALFELGKFSQARIQKYINGKISRLPPYLIKNGGLNSGLMIVQYTSAALVSENKVLVKPASVDSIVTSAGQEDHVSMGGYAARKCENILNNVSHILGIELLMSFTAANIIGFKSSQKLNQILEKVKQTIEPPLQDRYFEPDIEEATRLTSLNLQMI